ncbi:MAG: hypothetical protein M0T71_07830 [Actinomycetota bacterium]|jgi:hypothetical protein|nr:hypothetical protein [Actinomycetota bacterium]
MGWFRRRHEVPDDDEWGFEDRSLLDIERDPEMQVAQADADADPLTPRSPRRADDGLAW